MSRLPLLLPLALAIMSLRSDPTLSILAVCLAVGVVARVPRWDGGPPASWWATPPAPELEAEHRLAQSRCLPSSLFGDRRTAHLLPVISPALSELLAHESARHPFEHRSDEELIELLESVSGIGPKKAARLLPFLCSRERSDGQMRPD